MNKMFDSNDAKSLLSDNETMQSNISNIKVDGCISSFQSNISEETQANSGINSGNIESFLGNPNTAILPALEATINNLSSTINALETIDNQANIDALDSINGLSLLLAQNPDMRFDFSLDVDGNSYILFTQMGHLGETGTLLEKYRYLFTDGKSGVTIRAASCSMCSSFNAIANLIGIDQFLETMDIKTDLEKSGNSLNNSLLAKFNEILAEDYETLYGKSIKLKNVTDKKGKITLNVPKDKAIEFLAQKFSDKVELKSYYYQNDIPEDIFQKVANKESTLVVRIGQNQGRYNTKTGHFIEINDYKVENGEPMVFVLDSGKTIEETRNTLDDENKRRTGWVPLKDITKNLRKIGNEDNIFVFSLKEKDNGTRV